MKVAADADDKNFVGQPCCDQLLNNIWYHKMEPFQSTLGESIGLLISVCTLGLFAPFLISFRKDESLLNQSSNDQKRTFEMTVNQTPEEVEEEMKKALLPRTVKK